MPRRKPRAPYSLDIAVRLLNGLAQGRGLRALCREPGMPTRPSVMRWLKTRPDFAAQVRLARSGSGLDRAGRPSRRHLDLSLMDEVYDRVSAGEPLRTVCHDPLLPSRSTIQAWARRDAEVARTLDLARENAAWVAAGRAFEAMGGWDALKPPEPPAPGSPAARAEVRAARRAVRRVAARRAAADDEGWD